MTSEIAEWASRAEEDFRGMLAIYRSRKADAPNLVYFLGQQCVEKYLKARLILAKVAFQRTHDLPALLDQLATHEPLWIGFRDQFADLTIGAVKLRYPGADVDRAYARRAVALVKLFRGLARQSLGFRDDTKRPTARVHKRAAQVEKSRKSLPKRRPR